MGYFRNIYHKVCAFELNDHLKKVAKDCPDIKTAKYAVFYGFIDPNKGLMLELLGTAKSGKTRLNINEPYSGKQVAISVSEIDSDFFGSVDPWKFPKYSSHIEALPSDFISDEIEQSREDKRLDGFRDSVFPDHVLVRINKKDVNDQKILVKITGRTQHEFIGTILENPTYKCGLKKGDELRFGYLLGDIYTALDLVANLNEDQSDGNDIWKDIIHTNNIKESLITESDKVIFSIGNAKLFTYSLFINGVAPIQNVQIRNKTLDPIRNISIRVTSDSDIFDTKNILIYEIPGKGKYTRDIRPKVNYQQLHQLVESTKVNYQIELFYSDSGKLLCPAIEWEMDVLTDDHWPGDNYEVYLTAFITPNHSYLPELHNIAITWLKENGLEASLEDYQGVSNENTQRVLELANACFAAVQKKNISYITSPSTFRQGQRIRTVNQVIDNHQGTCMDMTLLYASLLESIGLHTVLMVMEDHIFIGIWKTKNGQLKDVITRNGEILLKENGLFFVECTDMCSASKNATFSEAMQDGLDRLKYYLLENRFSYAVDVFLARYALHIRPIDTPVDKSIEIDREDLSDDLLTSLGDFSNIGSGYSAEPQKAKGPANKIELWESKLLDLSSGNKLLNIGKWHGIWPEIRERFKDNENALKFFSHFYYKHWVDCGSTIIPLISCNLPELEDTLSDGEEFDIHKQPSYEHGLLFFARGEQFNLLEEQNWNEIDFVSSEHFRTEAQSHRVYSLCHPDDLNKNLKKIYTEAKKGEREFGINSLYLALGMLRWFDEEDINCDQPYYAPLILEPVEIDLRPGGQGYTFRKRNEDPQFNAALLERLRQEKGLAISGLDPLPTDEHGLDVDKIFALVRGAVKELTNWEVTETAAIGIFDNSKISMWNDIHTAHDQLNNSKVVRSLIEQHTTWDKQDINQGDDDYMTFITLPVDATQLEAIDLAGRGNSFVLHGPPGTGKSQTITGMIGNALVNHKKVLFVAKKPTALNVVRDRLADDLHIEDFCLALHTDTKKTDVLDQMDNTMKKKAFQNLIPFKPVVEKTTAKGNELDIYREHLHRKQSYGLSIRELIDRYCLEDDNAPYIEFHRENTENLTEEILQNHIPLIDRFLSAYKGFDDATASLVLEIGLSDYDGDIRSKITRLAEMYQYSLREAMEKGRLSAELLKRKPPETTAELLQLSQTIHEIRALAGKNIKSSDISVVDQNAALNYFSAWEALEIQRIELEKEWKPEIQRINISEFRNELASAQKKIFGKGKAIAEITKKLSYYARHIMNDSEVLSVLNRIEAFQKEESRVERIKKALPKETLEYAIKFPNAAAFQQAYSQEIEIQRKGSELTGGQDLGKFRNNQQAVDTNQAFLNSLEDMLRTRDEFNNILYRSARDNATSTINEELEFCDFLLKNRNSIKKVAVYNQYKEACIRSGLEPVVKAFENGMTDPDVLKTAYRKGFYYKLAQQAIYSDQVLAKFMGDSFDNSIKQFEKLETDLDKKSISELYHRLAFQLPSDYESTKIADQMTILRKAVKTRGRSTTLRQLFAQIPDILFRICPCMLMSPETVSQYLPQQNDLFDLVIFDEASQLETSHAVCSLYRGKDAIIVGDPKQMPPTKFFGGSAAPLIDPSLEDMDSILDDALAIGLPNSYLRWHYRSAHESLISFSNRNFYDNEMFTFPSVDDRAKKVRLYKLEGNYKSSVNDKEAIEIVKEIKRRFEDPKTNPKEQIGIIAFNEKQQKKIMELLAKQCEGNRPFYEWISEELRKDHSRVEVKPLEQVQGDEWDTVIFSITFGPNEKGTVLQNFGPINNDGGDKRLNVAFSRARKEMLIFTSMKSSDIKASENSPSGVRAFHDFLYFVESLNQDTLKTKSEREEEKYVNESSGIIKKLCQKLELEGYDCVPHIGSSDFQIDIGVLNPYDPSRYLLGIMLDGETYRKTGNTRDREIAQQNLLEQYRNWKIYRIWAMDWWENRAFVIERLLEYLETLKKEAEKAEAVVHEENVPESINNAALDAELTRQAEEVQAELDAEEAEDGTHEGNANTTDTNMSSGEVSSEAEIKSDPSIMPEPEIQPDPSQEQPSAQEATSEPETAHETEVQPLSEPQQKFEPASLEKNEPSDGDNTERSNPENNDGKGLESRGELEQIDDEPEEIISDKHVEEPEKGQEDPSEVHQPINVSESENKEQIITLMGLLEESGVEIIDKRPNGGLLWIIGGKSLKPLIARCKEIGVNFHFKAGGGKVCKGRDAWWTKDTDPAPIVKESAVKAEQTTQTLVPKQESVSKQTGVTLSSGTDMEINDSVIKINISAPQSIDNSDEQTPQGETSQETQNDLTEPSIENPDTPENAVSSEKASYQGSLYVETVIPSESMGWQEYCQPSNKAEIARRAVLIVEDADVIEKDKLIEKLRLSFSVRTSNDQVIEATERGIKSAKIKTTKIKGIPYCWGSEIDPKSYTGFHYHEEVKRKDEDLPLPEICNAIIRTLMDNGSLSEEEMITKTCRTFGYQRLGTNLKKRLTEGIDFAVTEKKIRINKQKKYEIRDL